MIMLACAHSLSRSEAIIGAPHLQLCSQLQIMNYISEHPTRAGEGEQCQSSADPAMCQELRSQQWKPLGPVLANFLYQRQSFDIGRTPDQPTCRKHSSKSWEGPCLLLGTEQRAVEMAAKETFESVLPDKCVYPGTWRASGIKLIAEVRIVEVLIMWTHRLYFLL